MNLMSPADAFLPLFSSFKSTVMKMRLQTLEVTFLVWDLMTSFLMLQLLHLPSCRSVYHKSMKENVVKWHNWCLLISHTKTICLFCPDLRESKSIHQTKNVLSLLFPLNRSEKSTMSKVQFWLLETFFCLIFIIWRYLI